jgi:hypothetical protein
MKEDRIEIKGQLIKGLLIGGLFILLVGIALYWIYFEYDANTIALVLALFVIVVGLLFIYLAVSAYLSCLVIDSTGIVKTNFFRGLIQIKWEEIASVVEKPGLEPGILKLEIVTAKKRRMDIYSNWIKDYDLLFALVDSRISIDTDRTRVRETTETSFHQTPSDRSDDQRCTDTSGRSTRTNLRLRVTGGQILYLIAMLIVTFFLFWQAFSR